MVKRDELADPASCLNRAADDEPLFVLRASDPLAVNVVRDWCMTYYNRHEIGRPMRPNDAEQLRRRKKWQSAVRLADAMVDWRDRNVKP